MEVKTKELGKNFKATSVEGKYIKKINNNTPINIYKKYLGQEISKFLPEITKTFPLMIKEGNQYKAKSILNIKNGAFELPKEITKGTKIKLGFRYNENSKIIKGISNLANSLNDELKAKINLLKSINNNITSNLDLDETAKEILKMILKRTNTKAGGIILKNKNSLELIAKINLENRHLRKVPLVENKGLLGKSINDDNLELNLKNSNLLKPEKLLFEKFSHFLSKQIKINEELTATFFLLDEKEVKLNDLKSVDILIDEMPIILEKAYSVDTLEKNVASLNTLQITSKLINSTLEMNELFNTIVDIIVGNIGANLVGIYLLDDKKNNLDLVANTNLPKSDEEILIKKGESIAWDIIKKQKNDFVQEEIGDKINEKLKNTKIKSAIFLPLKVREEFIGVLGVVSKYKRIFDDVDKKFLTTLSNQTAIAIENAKMYKNVKEMATKDGLTNLYNHSYFQEVLVKEIKKAKRYERNLSLLMMDIDNFKVFNDTYGHQAGDEILSRLGQVLKENIRTVDIPARYGGEEFAIILPETDKAGARIIANRIVKTIRNMEIDYKNFNLNITISLGANTLIETDDKADFIKKADKALYRAKDTGKNKAVIFNHQLLLE